MHGVIADMDLAPLASVAAAGLAAAWPAFAILRRAKPGRARSAVAYLMGFFAGLVATAMLAAMVGLRAGEDATIVVAGLFASFVAPFVGMVHAKLREPVRRRPRRAPLALQTIR
jgi:hypothetical protein